MLTRVGQTKLNDTVLRILLHTVVGVTQNVIVHLLEVATVVFHERVSRNVLAVKKSISHELTEGRLTLLTYAGTQRPERGSH